MERDRMWIIAGIVFFVIVYIGINAYQVANVASEADKIMERNTPLKNISENPENYMDEEFQTYGRYDVALMIDAPANRSIRNDEHSMLLTECGKDPLGERVFLNGTVEERQHQKLRSSRSMKENPDRDNDGDIDRNDTTVEESIYVIQCKGILN